MTLEPQVLVHPDADAVAEAAAAAFVHRLASAQAAGMIPQVALTGGGIAETFHRAVAASPGEVDWSRVVFWWGDERFVEADDDERNALQARRALLDALPVDPANVHEAPALTPGADPDATLAVAAQDYAAALREHGASTFTVMLLGIGPDGHVASLFPGHAGVGVEDQLTVAVPNSPKPPPARISLSLPVLNRSDAVWFLAAGEGKADAVRRSLEPGPVAEIPARGVRGLQETIYYVDEAAAPPSARA
ncbi:6-phosphogluconolactonase [Nocardioides massiliensis]|uniref:6-phosphogluconolactonase n=1 Tax=Nocardioides massiliensis TaxID=1325935 RepID=A0ABT9NS41_9ACTN|nr:6-phosphogluconolactonase [Nocardioides massiliensis]MDP9823126.1 6-phosphogluconolactonase [Nocardioides massiliensis]